MPALMATGSDSQASRRAASLVALLNAFEPAPGREADADSALTAAAEALTRVADSLTSLCGDGRPARAKQRKQALERADGLIVGATRLIGEMSRRVGVLLGVCSEDMETKDCWGMTALMFAARHGRSDVVSGVLGLGCATEARSANGCTVLMIAAENGLLGVVDVLAARGVLGDLDAADHDGRTALWWAAGRGRAAVAGRLLDLGCDAKARSANGFTVLMVAADNGHLGVVDVLAARGVLGDLDATDDDGCTALWWAACRGHAAMAGRLLDLGCDAGARSASGCTVLMVAAENGHLGVVDVLAARGVLGDLEAADRQRRTALWLAAGRGHAAVAGRLLDLGCDAKARGHFSTTVLMIAADNGHMGVVDAMAARGVLGDLDATNSGGSTALWLAAARGHAAVAGRLLDLGCDAGARSASSFTVLMVAAERGHLGVVDVLAARGVPGDLEAADHQRGTALWRAVDRGHVSIVGLLLGLGADPMSAALVNPDTGDVARRHLRVQCKELILRSIAWRRRQHLLQWRLALVSSRVV